MKMLIAALVGIGVAGPALAQAGGMALGDFQATARTRLLQADTSGDGRITKAEWVARPRPAANAKADPARMFDRLDANRDGALDQAELDTLLARRSRGRCASPARAARAALAPERNLASRDGFVRQAR